MLSHNVATPSPRGPTPPPAEGRERVLLRRGTATAATYPVASL